MCYRLAESRFVRKPMSITYEVSIVEKQPDGRNDIRVLLKTTDLEEANALVGALEQDGVKPKLTVFRQRKR